MPPKSRGCTYAPHMHIHTRTHTHLPCAATSSFKTSSTISAAARLAFEGEPIVPDTDADAPSAAPPPSLPPAVATVALAVDVEAPDSVDELSAVVRLVVVVTVFDESASVVVGVGSQSLPFTL